MIALVRVLAPPRAGTGTVELNVLPDPPGSGYSAFAVHCRGADEVSQALYWYRTVLESRPGATLGLIGRATDCIQAVADLDHSLAFVLDPGQLSGMGLPRCALEALRDAGIEGRILDEIVADFGAQILSERESLEALISRAVKGGTISRTASDLGVHPTTLVRWLKGVGISPRLLRQGVRMRAYELRVQLGMDPDVALASCGWTIQEQRRKAGKRLGGG